LNYTEALRIYQASVQFFADNPMIYFNTANLYYKLKDYELAVENYYLALQYIHKSEHKQNVNTAKFAVLRLKDAVKEILNIKDLNKIDFFAIDELKQWQAWDIL
jgi:tetratricopeptide (TPR) repeat protein